MLALFSSYIGQSASEMKFWCPVLFQISSHMWGANGASSSVHVSRASLRIFESNFSFLRMYHRKSFQTSKRAFSRAVLVFSCSKFSVTVLILPCSTLISHFSRCPVFCSFAWASMLFVRVWKPRSLVLMSLTVSFLQSGSFISSPPRSSAHRVASAPNWLRAVLRVTKLPFDLDIFLPSMLSMPFTPTALGRLLGNSAVCWKRKKVRWFGSSSLAEILRSTGYQYRNSLASHPRL